MCLLGSTLVGCRADSSSETQFANQENENETVPDYIRQSTILIAGIKKDGTINEMSHGTGTFVTLPEGNVVATAGHVVKNKKGEQTHQRFAGCHSSNGKVDVIMGRKIEEQPNCVELLLISAQNDDSKDWALLRLKDSSKLKKSLVAAKANLNATPKPNELLMAAGYGIGEGQGNYVDGPPMTPKENEKWIAEANEMIKKDLMNATDLGYADAKGNINSPPKFTTSARFLLRGGKMKVQSLDSPFTVQNDTAPSTTFTRTAILVRARPDGPQSTAGDSGTGWWMNGQMIGIHWGGTIERKGIESFFRLLSYYYNNVQK